MRERFKTDAHWRNENMKLKLIEKGKDYIHIEVSEPDETLIQPFIHQLLRLGEVEEVKYHREHPQIDLPEIYVKVSKGKPQNALKKAAKALSKQYRDALEGLKI